MTALLILCIVLARNSLIFLTIWVLLCFIYKKLHAILTILITNVLNVAKIA